MFEGGRVLCVGGNTASNVGQVGTDWWSYEAVATCAGTCLAVSSAGFVSFSDNVIPVVSVSTGEAHSCGNLRKQHQQKKKKLRLNIIPIPKIICA